MTETEHEPARQPTRRSRRLIAFIVVLSVLILLGAATIAKRSRTPSQVEATSEPRTATVERGDLVANETLDGTVEVANQIDVVHRIDEDSVGSGTSTASSETTPNASTDPTISARLIIAAEQIACPIATPDPTTTPTTTPDPTTTPTTTPDPTTTAVGTSDCDTTTSEQPLQATSDQTQPAPRSTPSGVARSSSGAGASTGVTPTTEFERVTSIVPEGTRLTAGDVIYTVEGAPIVAMSGVTPAWRDLSDTSDAGIDILQLETSLAALGYDDDGELSIDGDFDSHTSNAVENWQNGLGLEPTGEVTLGDVVFLPETALVSGVTVTVGDKVTDGDIILTLDSSRTQVTAIIPDDLLSTMTLGLVIELGEIEGTVERLISEQGESTVEVKAIIVPIGQLEAAPGTAISVRASTVLATDSLIVPAASITSRLDGNYAVRLATDSEPADWIPIVALAEADGDVAIQSSQLSEGATIVLAG